MDRQGGASDEEEGVERAGDSGPDAATVAAGTAQLAKCVDVLFSLDRPFQLHLRTGRLIDGIYITVCRRAEKMVRKVWGSLRLVMAAASAPLTAPAGKLASVAGSPLVATAFFGALRQLLQTAGRLAHGAAGATLFCQQVVQSDAFLGGVLGGGCARGAGFPAIAVYGFLRQLMAEWAGITPAVATSIFTAATRHAEQV